MSAVSCQVARALIVGWAPRPPVACVSLQARLVVSQRLSTVSLCPHHNCDTRRPSPDSWKLLRQSLGGFHHQGCGCRGADLWRLDCPAQASAGKQSWGPPGTTYITRKPNAGWPGLEAVCGGGVRGSICQRVGPHQPQPCGPVKSRGRVVLVWLVSLARREPCGWLGRGAL